ncbi:uncharacterized protein LOC121602827 [Anopheles merus]|uniref:uncharacterized protein LOC121602827 n=1 Tax=Anopheles merus TaxID=30066 RepID=UPI001BE4A081|nr:uncharacterized protein LOC121602827 [Anopheles merus]
MSVSSRWTTIKRASLCRTCLRKHPGACPVTTLCGVNGCERRHHQLLHSSGSSQLLSDIPPELSRVNTSCNVHSATSGGVMFKYVPVTLYGNGKKVDTIAILDDGSSATFMEHDLLRQLGISGKHRPLCISWTGNQSRVEDESVELSVKISGVGSSFIYDMNTVHTVRTLGLCDQSVEPRQLATQYSHLRGLPLPLYQNASAKVLIGIDNCFLSQTLKTVERGTNEPSASKTRLGWVVYGPCSSSASDCNRYDGNTFMNVHICPCNKKKDDEMDLALKEYFSLESLGVYRPMKQLRSDDEEHALKILSSNVRLVDGHFEASLLWKYDTIKLPDNKAMALRRHECLERKLRRNPN